MNNTVIACVDGSPSTRPVCEYAAWAARLLDAPLSLLHVLEKDTHPAVSDLSGIIGIDSQVHLTEELVKVEGERNRLLMAQGKAILAGCAELLSKGGCTDIRLLQRHGELDGILRGLGDIRLMILGRRGTKNPVGSHLESIIRLQKKPVLIVPEFYSQPSKIMFAYDGSEESRKNLTYLALSPLLRGLECHITMVKGDTQTLLEAKSILQKEGITVEIHKLKGESVAEALCSYASEHGINLIVMGAYGHSPLRRFFIGSNTSEMLEKTQFPLLMLR
ncbi:universal stress protein [Serratia rubidaea]|uniref:universal stress protein n=1 Tax=Serratia rubidaea TaxID=61652 RepID=UPI00234BC1B0|nr:universal stress protein [Serratia rubidaea]MDC6118770.1 universal stress protein [Serratia rubidaea]